MVIVENFQKVQHFIDNLNQARGQLSSLITHWTQITEMCREAILEDARFKAEISTNSNPVYIENYRKAIYTTYGVRFIDEGDVVEDLPLDYLALLEYHKGLDDLSKLYERIFWENPEAHDRFKLFQAIMGEITVIRTSHRPSESSGGNGYSSGHTIYDIFDSKRKPYSLTSDKWQVMTSLNFIHELFHSFMNFSAVGGTYWISNLANNNEIKNNAEKRMAEIDQDPQVGYFYQNDLGIFTWPNKKPTLRQNPTSGINEVVADMGLYSTFGLIEEFNDSLKYAIKQSIVYHMSPQELLVSSGYDTSSIQEGKVNTSVNIRPDPGDKSVSRYLLTNETVEILGKITIINAQQLPEDWLYVSLADFKGDDENNQVVYISGWVRADLIESANKDNLSMITPSNFLTKFK